jgi:hypothetical protein
MTDKAKEAWDAYFHALVNDTHTTEQVTALFKAAEAIKPLGASKLRSNRYYVRSARW